VIPPPTRLELIFWNGTANEPASHRTASGFLFGQVSQDEGASDSNRIDATVTFGVVTCLRLLSLRRASSLPIL